MGYESELCQPGKSPMPDYYEIDFLQVHSARNGDAIAIRIKSDRIGPSIWSMVGTRDQDHAEGLGPILEAFRVGRLWMLQPWMYAEILLPYFAR